MGPRDLNMLVLEEESIEIQASPPLERVIAVSNRKSALQKLRDGTLFRHKF